MLTTPAHANMRSMGSHGSDHVRFKKALAVGHLTTALIVARDLPHVSLSDALELCRLMAGDGDPRYPRAASRWLERFSSETAAGLAELQLAAAALGHLWESPDSDVARRTLTELLAAQPQRLTSGP
ncbi:MAG TPA: hypothetical protein VFS73_11245 [Solirubrobacterales bacterium]|jgi:hypothetical protein|nr:hypothetical protein [Solirubrobacterales bacterium]